MELKQDWRGGTLGREPSLHKVFAKLALVAACPGESGGLGGVEK
jgi:hypothetical protein